jgi:hypothetical protein
VQTHGENRINETVMVAYRAGPGYSWNVQHLLVLKRVMVAASLPGTATLPFVIPSEAEGSAVRSTSNQRQMESPPSPFVIPSEAEGSAVLFFVLSHALCSHTDKAELSSIHQP